MVAEAAAELVLDSKTNYELYKYLILQRMKKGLIITIAVVAAILLWGATGYNSLVSMEENVENQWAQVESQYQRRSDLIPNLVSTVDRKSVV